MKIRPMLAATCKEVNDLVFPMWASAKLDGIRCLVNEGVAWSRSMKPLPNKYIQKILSDPLYQGMDGEIIVGAPNDPDVFRRTTSAVMSHEGEPNFCFWVFDNWDRDGVPTHDESRLQLSTHSQTVKQTLVNSVDDLLNFEHRCLKHGFEGVILKSDVGKYKFGRSTMKEQYLVKLKRFEDSEAEIIGVEPWFTNQNESKLNELGLKKKASVKANLVAVKGKMGALIVKDLKTGIEFSIGTGFNETDRAREWPRGTIVKYKFFPVGVKEKPRHPVYLGIRDRSDM